MEREQRVKTGDGGQEPTKGIYRLAGGPRRCTDRGRTDQRGFTLVELMVTLLVIMIMAAAAVPMASSALTQFRLRAAVTTLTGAIQATRFQAISNGYQYKIALNKTNRTYQVLKDPDGDGVFANDGGAISFGSNSVPVGLESDATLQLSPSGKVTFVTGASPLVLKLKNRTGTVTVSTYGNLSVRYGS